MKSSKEKFDHFLMQKDVTQEDAFQLFDSLESVDLSFMRGLWIGKDFPAAHQFEGLLQKINWYGKEFVTPEIVHPLVMQKKNKERYSINPGLIPFSLPLEKLPHAFIVPAFRIIAPLLKTNAPKARLKLMEYRGLTSTAMVYDQHGIIDIFRKIDEDTVLGVMETRNTGKSGYFFILERDHYS